MAYKAKSKAAPKEPVQEQPKEERAHLCEICGESSVINDYGHRYCQPHFSLRLESISHEDTVAKVKRGEGCKSIIDRIHKRV